MGLDISFTTLQPVALPQSERHITHNLVPIAKAVGVYEALWRPESAGYTKAKDVLPIMKEALRQLRERAKELKALEPPKGYGSMEDLRQDLQALIVVAEEYPEADISSWP